MTQDEIIRMAREAGFEVVDGELRLYFDGSKALLKPNYMGTVVDGLKEFATLVAAHELEKNSDLTIAYMKGISDGTAHEREACAKVCEKLTPTDADGVCPVAAAIRARGEK